MRRRVEGRAAGRDGRAVPAPESSGELPARAVDQALADLLERSAERAEARSRSRMVNALVTGAAVLLTLGPLMPRAAAVMGELTVAQAAVVAALGWGAYELATLAYHLLGARHPLTRVLSGVDAVGRYAAPLALVYLSGSTSSPLWVVPMFQAYAWTAKPPRAARLALALPLVTFTTLTVIYLAQRRMPEAVLTVLVLLASTTGHTMSARMVIRGARIRAERDVLEARLREGALRRDRERMAREIHDGLGADIMALTLQLRLAAEAGNDPRTARLAERSRALLDELRGVVWSLRNEQGTLAELGKLIDATCRNALGSVAYERIAGPMNGGVWIGPNGALAALGASRTLVRIAASRPGVTKVGLRLALGSDLEIEVESGGAALSSEERERTRATLVDSLRVFDEVEVVAVSNRIDESGSRLLVTVALDAEGLGSAGIETRPVPTAARSVDRSAP